MPRPPPRSLCRGRSHGGRASRPRSAPTATSARSSEGWQRARELPTSARAADGRASDPAPSLPPETE
eukprot:9050283-Pyramimonas_sp.AAC.1